jgi:heterodisulfide reductase subunit A-like polyferredoxin
MAESTALLLCGLDCRPDLELDMRQLKESLRHSGVFRKILVEPRLCGNHLKKLSALKGMKIVFGGCPVLAAEDFYHRVNRALSLEPGDALTVDVMEEVLLRYAKGPGMERNLTARLLAAGRVLEHARSVQEETLTPADSALVYGSGLSGLHAALALANVGVPVDVLPLSSPGEPLSPGCLSLLLGEQRPLEHLRLRAEQEKDVSFLAAGKEMHIRGLAGGFALEGADGLRREYGCIVFAPERIEKDAPATGLLNLTQLYARLKSGQKLTGSCVLVFDYEEPTSPEVFRDGLAAALAVRGAGRARVWVLSRNVQVIDPGSESLYSACREAGVVFLKYREPLTIAGESGDFVLTARDAQSVGLFSFLHPEVVALSRPARLPAAALRFAGLLNLRLFQDAWAQPDSIWRLAQETSRPGVFACGISLGHRDPAGIERDARTLSRAVRQRLGPKGIAVPERLAVVDGEKCAFCLTCVRACPAGAVGLDREQRCAVVDPGACQACGICAAVCPARAIQLRNLGAEALEAGMGALV